MRIGNADFAEIDMLEVFFINFLNIFNHQKKIYNIKKGINITN
jgi:hypothetical protein